VQPASYPLIACSDLWPDYKKRIVRHNVTAADRYGQAALLHPCGRRALAELSGTDNRGGV